MVIVFFSDDMTLMTGLYELKPVEEKIFEAKITDVFHYGYTIESKIDGKLLRGLLFSYKPGFAHAVHAYLTRFALLQSYCLRLFFSECLYLMVVNKSSPLLIEKFSLFLSVCLKVIATRGLR